MITENTDLIKSFGRAKAIAELHIIEGNDLEAIIKQFTHDLGSIVANAMYHGMSKEKLICCVNDAWEELDFLSDVSRKERLEELDKS